MAEKRSELRRLKKEAAAAKAGLETARYQVAAWVRAVELAAVELASANDRLSRAREPE
jgi:hypothetical protein